MRDNFTRIAVILDRSMSMQSCRESTVTGFNTFIGEQKKLPGDATVKLVQFDTEYETVFDKKLQDAPKLTQETFVPRGNTALLDAQGKTIIELGNELEKLPEHERPSKVIVVTITDGEENSSKDFTVEKIAKMVQHQRDVYGWDFVFLGANQDAVEVGRGMNIPVQSAMTYSTSRAGVANTMRAASNYVRASRSGLNATFSVEERKLAMEDDDEVLVNANNVTGSTTTTFQK